MGYTFTAPTAEPRPKYTHTILDGDSLCKTCLERNQEERMQKGQKEIILVEIRDTVKEILKKLNQQ